MTFSPPALLVFAATTCAALPAHAADPAARTAEFKLTSPDLASAGFDNRFILNGFGCTGGNTSPALEWTNPPAGTRSFALQVHDPDAPTGSGFWHWAVYNLPATATRLERGAGNAGGRLPGAAFGGETDFKDTGATGGNGHYGGPCPPTGDAPHRYVFTLYALAVDDLAATAQIPRTGTPAVFAFALNRGIGAKLLGQASLTVRFGR